MHRDFRCAVCGSDCTIRIVHFHLQEMDGLFRVAAKVPVCNSKSCLVTQGAIVEKVHR